MSRSVGGFQLVRPRGDGLAPVVRRLRRGLRRGDPARPPRRISWGTALFVLAGLVVIGFAFWTVYGTSVLGVRDVEVTGVQTVPGDDVRAAAAVTLGTPLARVDTDAVAARVSALAPVASVEVSRSWPGTLVIDVTERVPAAAVAGPAGYVVLDAGGVVIHTVPQRPAGVLLLEVAAPGPADPATRAALTVAAALTPQLRDQVGAVSAPSPTDVVLKLAGGRTVIWGDAGQSPLKAQVATVLLGRPGKTIDVSEPDVATTS